MNTLPNISTIALLGAPIVEPRPPTGKAYILHISYSNEGGARLRRAPWPNEPQDTDTTPPLYINSRGFADATRPTLTPAQRRINNLRDQEERSERMRAFTSKRPKHRRHF